MTTAITLADVGFDEVTVSPLTADQTGIIAAVLDTPSSYDDGDRLPLLWHWAHFTPRTPTADLGLDGHPPMPDRLHDRYPRRMWASGEIEAPGHLVVGEPAERRSRIAEVKESEGRSGPLLVVTVRHELHQRDALQLIEHQTLIYRSAGGPVALPEGNHVPTAPPGGWVEHRCPDPVQLFRFSAITFNSHRIHYDGPYAREVEGYPALVVHGPLTALSVVASVERHTERRILRFAFKAVAPLFVGQSCSIVGSVDDDRVSATVMRIDGAEAMTTSASLGPRGS